MSIDFSKIKLVIWDLDNTFWNGVISESSIEPIAANIQLVKDFTACGIINSICSKNDFEVCKLKLTELGLMDLFVFSSINWSSKGQRIRDLITTMSLRPENVLFIDDDVTNLGEAQFYSQNIMISEPKIIPDLIKYISSLNKSDIKHKRLEQYKLLEKKNIEKQKYTSNDDFLFESKINVQIKHNCEDQLDRIHDLLIRSNQLNFTKLRLSKDELLALLRNKEIKSGYVEVKDKFGEYGIVGFYSLLDNVLLHFTFSCRTIGLGVEQYVYSSLNWPDLTINGEVVNTVENNPAPKWINNALQEDDIKLEKDKFDNRAKVLIKGPCDLSKTMNYVKNSDSFVYEFTYVNEDKDNTIEAHNHSVHIEGLKRYSDNEKDILSKECIFVDRKMFNGTTFTSKYDIIFLSTLIEANFGIYRKKGTDLKVAFGSYLSPLTESAYWTDYINKKLFTANNNFTEDFLRTFSLEYEFIGKTKPNDYIDRLEYILDNTDSKTQICLILGVEFPCEKQMEYDYKDRHISHKELNMAIRQFANTNNRIKLIDLNDIVKSQNDFTNNINHFTSKVYYELSLKITEIINEITHFNVANYSTYYLYFDNIINWFKKLLKYFLPKKNYIYMLFKKIYKFISRSKNNR